MPPLENQRHERFARGVAEGKSDIQAYLAAFGCSHATAKSNAQRMRADACILDRIKELQEMASSDTVLTLQEALQYTTDAVRASYDHLGADSPLIQSIKTTTRLEHVDSGDPTPIDVHEYKVVDRLRALELNMKLQGLMTEKIDMAVDDRRTVSKEERKKLLEQAKARRKVDS